MGGDFNLTLDPSMDTSTGRTVLSFRALNHVKQLFRVQHLVDSWRVMRTVIKDYSYYSKMHGMYSRLDLFLVDQFYLENVIKCTIEPITISDHAPITLTISITQRSHIERTWRLNESLLDNKNIMEELSIKIKAYFEINEPREVCGVGST